MAYIGSELPPSLPRKNCGKFWLTVLAVVTCPFWIPAAFGLAHLALVVAVIGAGVLVVKHFWGRV